MEEKEEWCCGGRPVHTKLVVGEACGHRCPSHHQNVWQESAGDLDANILCNTIGVKPMDQVDEPPIIQYKQHYLYTRFRLLQLPPVGTKLLAAGAVAALAAAWAFSSASPTQQATKGGKEEAEDSQVPLSVRFGTPLRTYIREEVNRQVPTKVDLHHYAASQLFSPA